MSETNVMREVRIEKVVVNIGVGEAGDRLAKAERVMEQLTNVKPTRTIATRGNRDWGVRPGQQIGVKATLRGETAETFLKAALWVRTNKVPDYSFDKQGNLSFGIPDHTDFENMRYDPDTGVFGLDIAVVFARPGRRVRDRRVRPARIGKAHRVSKEEAMQVMQGLGAEVVQTV